MKNYRYILFDWDGCLAKTLQVWMNAYKFALAKYGVNPTEQEIAYHFGDWELPKYFRVKDVDGCINIVDQMADADLKKVPLYAGAKNLLENLKLTKKLALLSSSPKKILVSALRHNNIIDYFEIVLSGEDVENHKPHPEVIEKAIKLLKANKDEAIMIGDSRKDIEAANNAGIDSILVFPESHKLFYNLDELKKYKPTRIVANLFEIQDVLK